jgi:hypothetical protein
LAPEMTSGRRAFVSCWTGVGLIVKRDEESVAWAAGLWLPLNDKRLEQAYNRTWYKEIIMDDVNPGQISIQLGQIVAQLAAIREALEKLVAQNDHPTYSQSKRY